MNKGKNHKPVHHTLATRKKISEYRFTQRKTDHPSIHYRDAKRVWEKCWRRKIPKGYHIHHVDKNYKNNNITNLALVTDNYHAILHNKGRNFYINNNHRGINNPMYGRKHTEESKRKMRETKLGNIK